MRFSSLLLFRVLVLLGTAAAQNAAAQDEQCYAKVVSATEAGVTVQFHAAVSAQQATDSIAGVLMLVPTTATAGFLQGSPSDPAEPGRDTDETRFTHVLTRRLAVMSTEVTRRMWSSLQAVQPALGPDPSNTLYTSGLDDPVQSVDWYTAVLFANLLSIQQGLEPCYYTDSAFTTPVLIRTDVTDSVYCKWTASGYRLPTEGEWEWFTRAEAIGPFSIDDPTYSALTTGCAPNGTLSELERVAWFCSNANNRTHPAGQLEANPWGLKDVHGNVWEWCWDWYDTYPTDTQTDYPGPALGSSRVYRGGGWFNDARALRSANRYYGLPGARYYNIGFRLVRTADQSSSQATAYQWDFGDGTSQSTEHSPTHVYETPGVYTWTLQMARSDGGSCEPTGIITVNPVAPTTLAATVTAEAITTSEASLSWSYSKSGIDRFRIERKRGGETQWSEIAAVSADVLSYIDRGLDPATIYSYRVLARSSQLLSKPSGEAVITTLPPYYAPAVVTQPASLMVTPGERAVLQVRAAGTGLSYQWYQVGSDNQLQAIQGATGSSFDTPPMTGSASYCVRISNTLGSVESEVVTVTTGAVAPSQPHKRYIPYARFGPSDEGLFSALAVWAQDNDPSDGIVTFTLHRSDGGLMSVPYNPITYRLKTGQQLARLLDELTGGNSASEQLGWVEIASSKPLTSFVQIGDADGLDGALPFQEGSGTLYFTRVYEGEGSFRGKAAKTFLSITNISDKPVSVRLKLYDPSGFPVTNEVQGTVRVAESQETIPAKGVLSGPIALLLDMPPFELRGGYLVASTEEPGSLAGLAILDLPEAGSLMVLNAATPLSDKELYSARIADVEDMFTNIKLVNTSREVREVTLKAIGEQGAALAAEKTLKLLPGATVEEDAPEIFEVTGGTTFVGSLRVSADGPGIIGDVLFGQPSSFGFAAAAPLQWKTLAEGFFSQVANGAGISTELSLFNPGSATANVTIEAYWSDGVMAGTNTLELKGGRAMSRGLDDLVPSSAGQIGGHLRVRSDQPLIMMELFHGTSFLSVVLPDIPESSSPAANSGDGEGEEIP